MGNKLVTIISGKTKNYFGVEEYKNKYWVYSLTYSSSFFAGKPSKEKIGETSSFGDALALIKSFINGKIDDTLIEDWD